MKKVLPIIAVLLALAVFTAAFKSRSAFFTDFASYSFRDQTSDGYGRINPDESGSDSTGKAYHFIISSGSSTEVVTTTAIEARGYNWLTYSIASTDIGDTSPPQTFLSTGAADHRVDLKVTLHASDLVFSTTTDMYMQPTGALTGGLVDNTSNVIGGIAMRGFFPVPLGGAVSKIIFDVSAINTYTKAATTSLMVRLD